MGFMATMPVNAKKSEVNPIDHKKIIKVKQTQSDKVMFEEAARLYESSADTEIRNKAFQLALASAEKGNADAQLLVSLMYEIGEGVGVDVDIAEQWRQKAAKNGHIDAKGIIALMGIAQDLDKQNIEKFKPYADEAYASGSIFGLASMAFVIHDGYGVEANEQEGKVLLLKAMSRPTNELNFFERIYLEDIQSLVLEIE